MRSFPCPWNFPLPWPSQSPSFLLLSLCPQLFNFFADLASWAFTLNIEVPWGTVTGSPLSSLGDVIHFHGFRCHLYTKDSQILTSRPDLFLRLQPVFPTASWTSPLECPILSSLTFNQSAIKFYWFFHMKAPSLNLLFATTLVKATIISLLAYHGSLLTYHSCLL